MFKLARFFKPYLLSILLIFALLFAQAMTDLALPDYMSNIVNVGLQQGGLKSPAPLVIRASQMDRLQLLMTAEDQAFVAQSYERLDPAVLSATELANLAGDYPILSSEAVDRRLAVSGGNLERLESILAKAIAMAQAIESGAFSAAMPGASGTDIFTVLGQLPAGQRETMLAQGSAQIAKVSASTLRQAASVWLTAEYQAVGLDTDHLQSQYILQMGGLMLLISLLGVICAVLVGFLSAQMAAGIARELRSQVFRKVEQFANAEFDKFSTASLITRTTNDIQQIQTTLVFLLRSIFYAPIMAIGGILKIVGGDVSMTWIIGLAVAVLISTIVTLFSVAMPRFRIIQKLVDRLNLVTREMLTGIMVTRAFNTQASQQQKFDQANQNLTTVNLFVSRIMVVMMPFMMLIMNATTLLIVWFGAKQIDLGSMQVGDMMAFMQYGIQIIFSFLMVSFVFIMLPRASVSASRIAEVLATDLTIRDPQNPVRPPLAPTGRIDFHHVSFRYPGAEDNVLCDINFTARPGETTAFIGSTGSGKSTLINLIPRFYDASEGQILVDGVDIRQMTQHDLREMIGYVPQKGTLFTGDIASNIRYGRPDASDKAVAAAARTAQALDFIESSEQGYQTEIAQGGTNVSGGQRQRLSIARALAKTPPIYIFDDSFSALDYKTDAALRQALKDDTAESTVLIVAQRIGTIRHAEQIIVLDQGQIVGIGQHGDLLANCPVYAEIAASQLSKEELTR